MIAPSEKKFERDPEEGNFPPGMYRMKLERVQEIGPSSKFPAGNPRLVFEFVHIGGQYAGKKAAMFVGKSISKTREGKESNLVKLGRSMGVVQPEKGFDPDMLLGKFFAVVTEFQDGRSWVRNVFPESVAAGGTGPTPTPSPAAGRPLPPRPAKPKPPEPADDTGWLLFDGTSPDWRVMTGAEVKAYMAANVTKGLDIVVCPESQADDPTAPKKPGEYGFPDGNPF